MHGLLLPDRLADAESDGDGHADDQHRDSDLDEYPHALLVGALLLQQTACRPHPALVHLHAASRPVTDARLPRHGWRGFRRHRNLGRRVVHRDDYFLVLGGFHRRRGHRQGRVRHGGGPRVRQIAGRVALLGEAGGLDNGGGGRGGFVDGRQRGDGRREVVLLLLRWLAILFGFGGFVRRREHGSSKGVVGLGR